VGLKEKKSLRTSPQDETTPPKVGKELPKWRKLIAVRLPADHHIPHYTPRAKFRARRCMFLYLSFIPQGPEGGS
jgi:hypothetical protein